MRAAAFLGAFVLGACQLTTSIGSSDRVDSGAESGGGTGTGGGTAGTGTSAGSGSGSGPGTSPTSGSGSTSATGSTGGTGDSGSGGTGSVDPCEQLDNPMLCFQQGCVWSFPSDECHDPGGGTGFDPPPGCEPDMQNGPCVDCLKSGCCQALLGCADDPDCSCLLDCIQQNIPLLQCQGACPPSRAAGYLSMCAGNACVPECG